MSWWQDTYKYAKLVMSLIAKTDRHETEIKELRDEVRKLSTLVHDLIFERRQDKERAEHARQLSEKDRELLLSRLENRLLRYERSLPPPVDSSPREDIS